MLDKKAVASAGKKILSEVEKNKAQAEKELAKMKKDVEATLKKAETFAKKNPEKAALIAAGIGAALGAVATALISYSKKKKK